MLAFPRKAALAREVETRFSLLFAQRKRAKNNTIKVSFSPFSRSENAAEGFALGRAAREAEK